MLFIYFLLAVLDRHCMGFPLVAESRGSSLSCGAWAARRGGYPFAEHRLRGAQASGVAALASVVAAPVL